MIILRLLSLVFTLCGLAVIVGAVWLMMGNELTIPESELFGAKPEVKRTALQSPPEEIVAAAAVPEPEPFEADTVEEAAIEALEDVVRGAAPRGFPAPVPGDNAFRAQSAGAPPAAADPLAQMRTVPIAYEAPQRAQFARPFEVTVVVDGTGDTSAADTLDQSQQVIEGEAQVTDRVRVSVTGAAFEIEALSPDVQVISPMTENIWRFKTIAREAGEQDLAVEIFALNEENDALPVRTYRDEITIDITRIGRAIAFAQEANPVAALLGGVGSMLAGFFGFVGFFRKRKRR